MSYSAISLLFPPVGAESSLFQQTAFLNKLLPAYLTEQRWFTNKSRQIKACYPIHSFQLTPNSFLLIISVAFEQGDPVLYQLPLAFLTNEVAKNNGSRSTAPKTIASDEQNNQRILVDAVELESFRKAIFNAIQVPQNAINGLLFDAGKSLTQAASYINSKLVTIDSSNTAIIYNDRFFFKLFRKLDPGLNPDIELTRYLSEQANFQYCPTYGGSFSIAATAETDIINLGLMIGLIENQGDAWAYFQQLVEKFYDNIISKDLANSPPPRYEVVTNYKDLSNTIKSVLDKETYDSARLLGQRTAEMHLALHDARQQEDALQPEVFTDSYREEIFQAAQRLLERQFSELRYKLGKLPPAVKAIADSVLLLRQLIEKKLSTIRKGNSQLTVSRIHADYHLGQVLVTQGDFVIIDFEGEPLLSVSERRRKRPPFKDLAGMVRSFHYAAIGQLLLNPKFNNQQQLLSNWGGWWFRQIRSSYLNGYMSIAEGASFVPDTNTEREELLDFFVLEKAIYEVAYELNSRPEWLPIPLKGMLFALQDE